MNDRQRVVVLWVGVVCGVGSGLGRRSLVHRLRTAAALQYDRSLRGTWQYLALVPILWWSSTVAVMRTRNRVPHKRDHWHMWMKNVLLPEPSRMPANFRNPFTWRLSDKSVIRQSLKIPLHHRSVATLPREILGVFLTRGGQWPAVFTSPYTFCQGRLIVTSEY